MKIPQHRIAPSLWQYELKENERRVGRAWNIEDAGPDPELNYALYVSLKDPDEIFAQVDGLIAFAKKHPDLLLLIDKDELGTVVSGKVGLIPFFLKAFEVDNIALPEYWWNNKETEGIGLKEGRVTFHGVVKRPLALSYQPFSNQIRYGVASGRMDGRRMYFAFHGSPSRNDDYYVVTSISEQEYDEACRIYGPMGSQGRETGDKYCETFINGHTVLCEGWSMPDIVWIG